MKGQLIDLSTQSIPLPVVDIINKETEVLNIDEAASFIKRKKATVYALVHQKKIPHSKPNGGKLIFFKSELNAWLKSFSVPAKESYL